MTLFKPSISMDAVNMRKTGRLWYSCGVVHRRISVSLSKAKAKELLQKSVDAITELQKLSYSADEFTKWRRDTEVAIECIFSNNSRHLKDFGSIGYSPTTRTVSVYRPSPPTDPRPYYARGLNKAK